MSAGDASPFPAGAAGEGAGDRRGSFGAPDAVPRRGLRPRRGRSKRPYDAQRRKPDSLRISSGCGAAIQAAILILAWSDAANRSRPPLGAPASRRHARAARENVDAGETPPAYARASSLPGRRVRRHNENRCDPGEGIALPPPIAHDDSRIGGAGTAICEIWRLSITTTCVGGTSTRRPRRSFARPNFSTGLRPFSVRSTHVRRKSTFVCTVDGLTNMAFRVRLPIGCCRYFPHFGAGAVV